MGALRLESTSLEARVDNAVRPSVTALGYDLVLVEQVKGGRIMRLYIDTCDGREINVDDCAKVSRQVSDILDAEGVTDDLSEGCSLEVSSPGLDRPLTKAADYLRFVGEKVKLRVAVDAALSNRRRYSGVIVRADAQEDGGVTIDFEGTPTDIAYSTIEDARLVPNL